MLKIYLAKLIIVTNLINVLYYSSQFIIITFVTTLKYKAALFKNLDPRSKLKLDNKLKIFLPLSFNFLF